MSLKLDKQGYYRINEMLIGQLKNLEEMVLHTIAQEKMIKAQAIENAKLRALVQNLEDRMMKLEEPKNDRE